MPLLTWKTFCLMGTWSSPTGGGVANLDGGTPNLVYVRFS